MDRPENASAAQQAAFDALRQGKGPRPKRRTPDLPPGDYQATMTEADGSTQTLTGDLARVLHAQCIPLPSLDDLASEPWVGNDACSRGGEDYIIHPWQRLAVAMKNREDGPRQRKKIASDAGIIPSRLTQALSGQRGLTQDLRDALAQALGVSAGWAQCGVGVAGMMAGPLVDLFCHAPGWLHGHIDALIVKLGHPYRHATAIQVAMRKGIAVIGSVKRMDGSVTGTLEVLFPADCGIIQRRADTRQALGVDEGELFPGVPGARTAPLRPPPDGGGFACDLIPRGIAALLIRQQCPW